MRQRTNNKEQITKNKKIKNLLSVICYLLSAEGFTLIEVLVVATIIGILSTIGISSFQAVTKSGRDALRRADLEQIRSALEIYKSENGSYPEATGCRANLSSDYIGSYPLDPKSSAYNYCYIKEGSILYKLCAHLENGNASDNCDGGNKGDSDPDDGITGNCNYQVTNP